MSENATLSITDLKKKLISCALPLRLLPATLRGLCWCNFFRGLLLKLMHIAFRSAGSFRHSGASAPNARSGDCATKGKVRKMIEWSRLRAKRSRELWANFFDSNHIFSCDLIGWFKSENKICSSVCQSHGCVSVNRANRGLPLEILFCERLQKRLLFDLNPLGDVITGLCKPSSLKDF